MKRLLRVLTQAVYGLFVFAAVSNLHADICLQTKTGDLGRLTKKGDGWTLSTGTSYKENGVDVVEVYGDTFDVSAEAAMDGMDAILEEGGKVFSC